MLTSLHSCRNHIAHSLRNWLRFSRKGYREQTTETPSLPAEAQRINEQYEFYQLGPKLAPRHWHRNLATIWMMEQMLEGMAWPDSVKILEPGSQNFSRLPAFYSYFRFLKKEISVTGLEIDPYVPLKGWHSYWDQAHYYMSLCLTDSRFLAEDFFTYTNPADLIICFYPFVSPEPALAWGLSAKIASPQRWVDSFCRNLKKDGFVFVVHQGDWEESEFDRAREKSPLKLIKRQILDCPFFKTKYPAHASLYQLIND